MKRKDIPTLAAINDKLFKHPLTKRTMRDFRIIEYFLFVLKVLFVLNSVLAGVSLINLVISFNHNRLFSTLNVVVVAIIYIIIALLIVYLKHIKIKKNTKLFKRMEMTVKDPFNEILYYPAMECYVKRPRIPHIYEVEYEEVSSFSYSYSNIYDI